MNGLEKEHGHTHVGLYVQAMAKWLAVALVTGVCCGVVGSLFHIGVERATELREQHPWLLWCLPAAGLVIVAFYKLTKTEGQGTNDIIDAVHHHLPGDNSHPPVRRQRRTGGRGSPDGRHHRPPCGEPFQSG